MGTVNENLKITISWCYNKLSLLYASCDLTVHDYEFTKSSHTLVSRGVPL